MFAKFAVILLSVFSIALSGCMFGPINVKSLDVPKEVKTKLAGKRLQDFPLYVDPGVVHYDTTYSPPPGTKTDGLYNRILPRKEITEEKEKAAEIFVRILKEEMKKKGFSIVEVACKECLEAKVDFQYISQDQLANKLYAVAARLTLSYKGMPLVVTSNNTATTTHQSTARLFSVFDSSGKSEEVPYRRAADRIIGGTGGIVDRWTDLISG